MIEHGMLEGTTVLERCPLEDGFTLGDVRKSTDVQFIFSVAPWRRRANFVPKDSLLELVAATPKKIEKYLKITSYENSGKYVCLSFWEVLQS